MIEHFGGWEAYRSAPSQVVQEQALVWTARIDAESDQHKEQQRKTEQADRDAQRKGR